MNKAKSREEMFRDQLAGLVMSHDTAFSLGYLESVVIDMFSRLPSPAQFQFTSQLAKTNSDFRLKKARAHMINVMQNEG